MDKPEIRIHQVEPRIYNELMTIAQNKGISLSSLMKHHLDFIIQHYPAHLRVKRPRDY